MMGEQDLNPLGFHRHPPGRRMPSMMAPTVVLRDGRPSWCWAAAGRTASARRSSRRSSTSSTAGMDARRGGARAAAPLRGRRSSTPSRGSSSPRSSARATRCRASARSTSSSGESTRSRATRDGRLRRRRSTPRRRRRGSLRGVKRVLVPLAAAVALAGCGNRQAPDLFVLTRTGSIPGARLTLRVSDDGFVRCNGGATPAHVRPAAPRRAGDRARSWRVAAKEGRNLPPGPRSVLRYRLRLEGGTVRFSDTSRGQTGRCA